MSRNDRVADDDENSDVIGDEDEFRLARAATPEEVEDNVKRIFEQDVDEAWKLEKRQRKDPLARDKFLLARDEYIKEHYQNWMKRMPDERNFLHFLAYQSNPNLCQQWVVARAVSKLPKLMGELDRDERTPLAVAIHCRNKIFIHAICKNINIKNKAIIREALRTERHSVNSENRLNCLQAAVSGKVDADYALDIIKLVPDEMFGVVDVKGRTPLHLAVEYIKSSSDQVLIVKDLLSRGPGALKIRSSDGPDNKLSAYQYHVKTRKDYKTKDIRTDGRKQMKPPPVPISAASNHDEKQSNLAKKNEMTKLDRSFKDATRGDPKSEYPLPPTPTGDKRVPNLGKLEALAKPTVPENFPNMSRPISKLETPNEEQEKSETERQRSSDEILSLLKLEYLRTMKPLEALDYLQIRDLKDKELWFDFGSRPQGKFTTREFERKFDHLQFDEVLQYVAFPQLELDNPLKASDDSPDHGKSRQDMKFIFGWLKKKGVKRILRVEVDDMKFPNHSDEVIEQALEDLHVEVMDWKRLDLDPGTIQKIGSDLREIQLYWSGGNNVLRSWSETNDGLCLIKSLRKIKLTQVEGLESEIRTQHNLNVFRNRLDRSWGVHAPNAATSKDPQEKKRIEVEIIALNFRGERHEQPDPSTGTFTTTLRLKRHVDPHKWMECMEKFANSFRQIPELRKKRQDTNLGPVKIALIDDGVDITHKDLRGLNNQNLPGKSFDYSDNGHRVSPYWISASGHGTLMARLIRRVCPSAIVYVIKVRTISTVNSSKAQIEIDSTIKAINHAIDIGAHMISMSWTTKPPGKATERDEFNQAISRAGSKPILMFCAASDQGQFEDFTYPHASNPALTFRIGAAKATGGAAEFVGDGVNFVFPGQDVVLRDTFADTDHERNFADFASHTGSSVATALAAGLAAVVYECVRLGVIHTSNPQTETHGVIQPKVLTEICHMTRMKKCFESIGVNVQSGKPYLEVWKRFEEPGKEIERFQDARDEQLRTVWGLARLLLEMTS